MPLEMKPYCQCCNKRILKRSDEVYICSYEATFCKDCAEEKSFRCSCCEGKLEKRPARIIKEIKVIPINNLQEVFLLDIMPAESIDCN